jgi:hypothetical protein
LRAKLLAPPSTVVEKQVAKQEEVVVVLVQLVEQDLQLTPSEVPEPEQEPDGNWPDGHVEVHALHVAALVVPVPVQREPEM